MPPTGVAGDYGTSDIILKAGYLIRSAQTEGKTLNLVGDVNATTPIEVIGGAPANLATLNFNGKPLDFAQDKATGVVTAEVSFLKPDISLPALDTLSWKKLDSLPEVSGSYDDSTWTLANLTSSPNDYADLETPVSLRAGDYGFHAGSVLFRGHFAANGDESTLDISTQGGLGFGSSVWLDSTFLGSFAGAGSDLEGNSTFDLPSDLAKGSKHVLTVVVDNMGLNENYDVGENDFKQPRGITRYALAGHDDTDITWKVQGNLGGERYADKTRGPLNEGATYAERKGYHLPSPPSDDWEKGSPADGVEGAGITLYTAEFDLDLPEGYDVPLSVDFNTDVSSGRYRLQLFVNGYQFGKFVPHIGPQDRYPIPEGVIDHHGRNTIALTVWALDKGGTEVKGLKWHVGMVSKTGFGSIENSPAPKWAERKEAR